MRDTILTLLLAAASVRAGGPALFQVDVYRAGQGGYHTYRIPALMVTPGNTLLAFCEGRRHSRSDTGDIDLLLRRSRDNGATWLETQLVADQGQDTIGNPCPVVDRTTGVIWLLLTGNPGRLKESQILAGEGEGTRTVWITRSQDDGATWAPIREITSAVKHPDWTWYATGPGNGIQLRGDRLLVPCNHAVRGTRETHSHVIYSDDHGATWRLGGSAGEKTDESTVIELKDGTLLLNMRNYRGKHRRAVARSRDGGLTWSETQLDEALIEPVCQGSLIRYGRGDRLLFSNPAAETRINMTVRLSRDGGRSWPGALGIHAGPSAYSSLAVLKGGAVGLLYERGEVSPYETITFARFPIRRIKTLSPGTSQRSVSP